jgi:cytochrome bd-type quinol oxidase subunit 1
MLSRTLTTAVVIALALAMFVAWAGHTYTLSAMSQQPAWEFTQDAHHDHEQAAEASCESCSDHYHSPLTPDHQHETPQLTSALNFSAQPEPSQRVDALRYWVPRPPIFLIERPPCPSFAS